MYTGKQPLLARVTVQDCFISNSYKDGSSYWVEVT